MTFKKMFTDPERKQNALYRLTFKWSNSGKIAVFYSTTSDENKGLDKYIRQMEKRFVTPDYRSKIKDDQIRIYNNKIHSDDPDEGLLAEFKNGVRV
jgi:hypothetical protein